ncbi:hypothetical protein [Halostagnicola larsenii]|uniref:hypothetical protein n=1 Tax=Halostagnicola larsenii TaxID=353800 RepID=UPI0012F7A4A0|nr:hypothetical protein [Halostagnicola larsenii]
MVRNCESHDSIEQENELDGLALTRRTVMALLGAGGVAAVASGSATASHGGGSSATTWNENQDANNYDLLNLHSLDTEHVHASAREAEVIVWRDDNDVYHADGQDGEVASGEDFVSVTQSALDSLTSGRTWKETVRVVSPGETDRSDEIFVPSYTVFDVAAPIVITAGDDFIPIKSQDTEHVEIPRFRLQGSVDWGIFCKSVKDLHIGDVRMDLQGSGLGVRVDASGDNGRSEDVRIDSVFIERADNHGVETRGVDRLQVGRVLGKNVSGCTLLLNETGDATVGDIMEYSPNPPGTTDYATFRTTYQQGRVTADNIVSHQADRGLHIHGGSGEIAINNVYIANPRGKGAVLNGCPNTILNGGVIKNCNGEAIDVYTIDDPSTNPEERADGIKVTNMRIYDDRDDPQQTEAIDEGGNAQNNQYVDNDLRDGGTNELIRLASPTTVVRDNVGAGVSEGTVTLTSGSSPAARVKGVDSFGDVTLDLRAKPVSPPSSAMGWDHRFEWDGSQWDLIIEWTTDPGQDMDLDYIVDRPQANLGRYP